MNQADRKNYSHKNRALVLVLVLWLLVLLTVLTVAMTARTRLDNTVRTAVADKVDARWLARAGVHLAMAKLAEDQTENDSFYDSWYDDEEAFRGVKLEGGSFTVYGDRLESDNDIVYGVVDEASKLNVNVADLEQLTKLEGMYEGLAESIVRRREEDEKEIGYRTIRQLALADSMDMEVLYGEDVNLNGILDSNENDGDLSWPADNADGDLDRGILSYVTVHSYELNQDGKGQRRININTADEATLQDELELEPAYALWIVENRKYEFISDLLDKAEKISDGGPGKKDSAGSNAPKAKRVTLEMFIRIADRITVSDEEVFPGRININTAGREVLATLPEVGAELAEMIINHRTDKGEGFGSIAELLMMQGMTIDRFKKIESHITVRSNVFTIRSSGKASRTGLRHNIEAIVDRGRGDMRILYWKED